MQPVNTQQSPDTNAVNNEHSARHYRMMILQRVVAALVAVAIGVMFLALPENLTIGPNWILLVVEAVLFIPLLFFHYTRQLLSRKGVRLLTLTMLGAATLGLAIAIILLVLSLTKNSTQATVLLRSAALLWVSNVLVFSLWYWEVDGGGPYKRHLEGHKAVDLMFPQQVDGNKSLWVPHFLDYLFVAFTGATALSPTDTFPLTRVAKGLMMIEATLSMLIILLLAARAVNIL